jgi:4-methoxybenzoate monooxygenase (O-demethylating)
MTSVAATSSASGPTFPSDPQIPILDIDPYADEVIDNPHRFEKTLRDAGPVVWLRHYGVYAVGRFKEAEEVFSDQTRFWCTAGVGLTDIRKPESLRDKNPLMEVEPAVHAKARRGMLKIMSPPAMRDARSRFDQAAGEFVDRMISRGTFDGVHDLVEPYILDVFPDTVGIKVNPETVLLFGDLNFNANGPFNDLYRAAFSRVEKHLPEFEDAFKRHNMIPGGMGAQMYEAEDAGVFDQGTAIGFVRVLFRGGFDTTIAGISAALYQLTQNADAWNWLRANPERAMLAFDEALRLVSPFRVSHRVTIEEGCELSGVQIEGDRKIGIFMAAANRDPRKWRDPEAFDLQRKDLNDHLAFGAGAHKCIGLLLAKYEAEALLKALVQRAAKLEFVGAEPPSYKRINTLRTMKSLPLRISK